MGTGLGIYTLFDEVANRYNDTICAESDAEVMRHFQRLVNDDTTQIGMYHKDYTLYKLGVMDKSTGEITPKKVLMVRGAAVRKDKGEINE